MYQTRFCLYIICCLIGRAQVHGQKQNNVWIFGNHAGLDFNTSQPTALHKTPVTFISCCPVRHLLPYYVSSICDTNGKLLFYTDGSKVWDKRNKEIPTYAGRWPWSGHVMPLICPYPGNDSLYYIFGVSDASYANRLQYLSINMKGNGGAGEIVYPQPSSLDNYYTVLLHNASVLIAGTSHCNNKDTWIAAHSKNSFYSFLVTEKGVDPVPVVTEIDPAVISPHNIYAGLGNIKFSANGERMALPVTDENKIVVFDFNNATGKFSNPIVLNLATNFNLEDIELSPDGSKLYYGAYEVIPGQDPGTPVLHDVFQMNLDVGTPDDILKTTVKVTVNPAAEICTKAGCIDVYRTLELAPNGKIYMSKRFGDSLLNLDVSISAIENPNAAGALCFYKPYSVDLGTKYAVMSCNYIRSQTFTPKEQGIQVQESTCADKPVSFSLFYSLVDSVKWDFGDPGSGNKNFSRLFKPQHTYPGPGNYTAKAIVYRRCFVDTAIKQFTISPDSSVHISDSIKNVTMCTGDSLKLDASTPYATGYLWNNGLIYPNVSITSPGDYSLIAYNACSTELRRFSVKYADCPCDVYMPSAFSPNEDGLNDYLKPGVYCQVTEFRFAVYNRFGERLFYTTQKGDGWNGYNRSLPASQGIYVWTLEYRNPNNKKLYRQHGSVVLVR